MARAQKPGPRTSAATAPSVAPAGLARGLGWKLRLTWAGLLVERVTIALWPLWSLAMAVWAVLALGLLDGLQLEYVWTLWVVFGALLIAALVHAVRSWRWPTRQEAAERLDQTLPGRPLAALTDAQVLGAENPASRALWRAHRQRMLDRLAGARPVKPDLRLSRRDPYALRYVAATVFVVALLFGTMPGWQALTAAVTGTGGGGNAVATGPSFEAWVEPPAYTGAPTLYLNDVPGDGDAAGTAVAGSRDEIEAPSGSVVTLRIYGDLADISVTQSIDPDVGSGEPAHEMTFRLTVPGRLDVTAGGEARSWTLTPVADAPPQIELAAPVEGTIAGSMTLQFHAMDDYGVNSAAARLELDLAAVDRRHGLTVAPDPRPAIELDLPLPFTGNRRDIADSLVEDLSRHAYAGLPMQLHLSATDEAGQQAAAAPVPIILPARKFYVPLAAAIAENRRDLLWSVRNAERVSMVLRAVTHRPQDIFEGKAAAWLSVRAALRRLEAGMRAGAVTPELRDEVADLLWHAALLVEEGDLNNAEERLRRAQERLSEALRQGASEDEIRQLTEEMARAMEDYMRNLAQNARPQDQQQAQGETQQITPEQLQEMLDRIEELSRQGRRDEARQLLDQLRRMLENMQVTQGQQGQGGNGQAMEDLQDTLRQQQGLADDAFRNLQEQFNRGARQGQSQQNQGRNGGQGQGESHDGQGGTNPQAQGQGNQGGGTVPSARELADRQRALRDELERQQRTLPAPGTEEGRAAREALGRAGRAMDRAEDALRQNDMGRALDDQAEAMEALRDGIRNLGEALARAQDRNRGRQGQQAGRAGREDLDPLGRRTGSNGRVGTEQRLLGEVETEQRTRELLDEIRRRSSDRSRPVEERQYLERLLDRF